MSDQKSYINDMKKIPANMRVICDDGELKIVSEIVSARAPSFGMFIVEYDRGEKVMLMRGKKCSVMKIIFDYVQWSEIQRDDFHLTNTIDVYNASKEYKLPAVEKAAVDALIHGATNFRVASRVYFLCELDELKFIRAKALEFIRATIGSGNIIYKCNVCSRVLPDIDCKKKSCCKKPPGYYGSIKNCAQCGLKYGLIICGRIDLVENIETCRGFLESKVSHNISWTGVPDHYIAQIMRELCA